MNGKGNGAAIRQDHRSEEAQASRLRTRTSIAQAGAAGDGQELSPGQFAGSVAVGLLSLLAFMWLAAAY